MAESPDQKPKDKDSKKDPKDQWDDGLIPPETIEENEDRPDVLGASNDTD